MGILRKSLNRLNRTGKTASQAAEDVRPSPSPATNLLIADLALRGGGQLLRHAVERGLLGKSYSPEKAKNLIKGRSMGQTLIGTAIARIATRSVPGALIVGGGLLAKTLYDRKQGKEAAEAGEKTVEKQAKRGRS